MQPLAPHERAALAAWIVLAIALWNGIFEMDPAIYHATWVATLWTSVVLLAALLTIRTFSRRVAR